MTGLVVDVSVAGAWILPDETSPAATRIGERVLAETALAPDLFWYEVRNLLVQACRRGRIPEAVVWRQLERLETMPIQTVPMRSETSVGLALKHRLTAYDASYLALAQARVLPLATFDRDLVEAARAEGVAVVGDAP